MNGSPASVLARASHVTHRFGHFTAVDDVSMTVAAGEVVGLLGANGAGKTTLIRMLLGLLAVLAGSVDILGGPPDRERRRRLGYVPQGLGLYTDLTVAENLRFVARTYGSPLPTLPDSLDAVSDRLVGAVSLGLQRQLAFVCALLHHPELLVLDEPTSGVDPVARAGLWDTIHQQSEAGVGVLVTTHYMQEAQQCGRLLLMSAGRLVSQGSEADVIGDTTAVQVETDDWGRAFERLGAAGFAVTLSGRSVRVANSSPGDVQAALRAAGLPGEVTAVPATIEERMTVLAQESAGPAG